MASNRHIDSACKTYFLIDKPGSVDIGKLTDNSAFDGIYENELPIEFANATCDKWIEVKYCFATFKKYLVTDMVLHADFIKRDAYLDHAVSVINFINNGARPDKYSYPVGAPRRFRIWFTDLDGNRVVPDSFQMKMLLIA